MRDFIEWLLAEAHQEWVPASVLQAYDVEFKKALQRLIERTRDPVLKSKFREMLDCPIHSVQTGRCYGFAEYILSALVRNGVQNQFDIEGSLSYVVEKLLMDRSDSGERRTTVFDFDETRPYSSDGNPMQARLLRWIQFAVNTVRRGKVRRLAHAERPRGTLSIGAGRQKEGDQPGEVSPDEIPAKPSDEDAMQELIADVEMLLRQKEPAYGFPLVRLFRDILGGMNTEEQRRTYGDRKTRVARHVILQALQEYGERTNNYLLLNLLKRFEGFQSNKPLPQGRMAARTVKQKLSDRERDFASILAVIDRSEGQPVGSAQLGSARRRWLEYQPRDPNSGHPNRLQEVLASAVAAGVLQATRTKAGAFVYSPGPNADQFRRVSAR